MERSPNARRNTIEMVAELNNSAPRNIDVEDEYRKSILRELITYIK